jgi:thiamine-monophosphate kinase
MGAKPLAFTLALSLPQVQPEWLAAFSDGMFKLADEHGCELIGGDTTRGPLNICITVFGEVPAAQALRRDAAKAGDDIWVSGSLGDARLALAACKAEMTLDTSEFAKALQRLDKPIPRVALGMAIRGIARAAIDVSDGLIGDLQHILKRSGVGAVLNVDALPAGPSLTKQAQDLRRRFALAGGDDYELCFIAPASLRNQVEAAGQKTDTPVTRVGSITAETGMRLVDASGNPLELAVSSFDHFAAS